MRATLHRLQLRLFHAGKIDSLFRPASKPSVTVSGWDPIPQLYRDNAHRYIEQVRLSGRPSTVKHIEQHLRVFGTWLAERHREVRSCAELERGHIEDFKIWISTTPSARTGKPPARTSVKEQLINLGCFFERTTNWGYPNAPSEPLLFAGDLPRIDGPLPRFLDDAAAAKLARATRAEPDPLARLCVEILARTGIRLSELIGLTVDAVVQTGSAFWLRIPVGKLHNDRYIPLHPKLKTPLDDWIDNHRPSGLRSNRLLLERGRPITKLRVANALARIANDADIGHVTPHQLRHTLATQAINRHMSLEAIAALLGHKTLAMTMVYAPHRRQDRRRRVLRRHRQRRGPLRPTPPAPRQRRRQRDAQTPCRDAPAHARQRLLRPTRRDGLPLRIDLRVLQLLRHHDRVQTNAAPPTRRRRRQGPDRSPEDLRRPPRPTRPGSLMTSPLDPITRIS